MLGDSVDDTITGMDENAAGQNAVETGLNQPARDGKFEFTVSKVDCGATRVGSDLLDEKAQGVFCLVDVTVKNIGDEAQLFDGSSQKPTTPPAPSSPTAARPSCTPTRTMRRSSSRSTPATPSRASSSSTCPRAPR